MQESSGGEGRRAIFSVPQISSAPSPSWDQGSDLMVPLTERVPGAQFKENIDPGFADKLIYNNPYALLKVVFVLFCLCLEGRDFPFQVTLNFFLLVLNLQVPLPVAIQW